MFAHLVSPGGQRVGSRPAFLIATLLASAQFGLLIQPKFGNKSAGAAPSHAGVTSAVYLLPMWPTPHPGPSRVEHVHFTAIGVASRPGAGIGEGAGPGRSRRQEHEGGASRRAPASVAMAVQDSEPQVYDGSRVYIEPELQHPAARDPSSDAPMYPDSLRTHGIEGLVVIRFIVDTGGRADSSTLRFLEASNPGFANAVRAALPRMRFIPAQLDGRHVPQLVSQEFRFVITRVDTIPAARGHRRAKA